MVHSEVVRHEFVTHIPSMDDDHFIFTTRKTIRWRLHCLRDICLRILFIPLHEESIVQTAKKEPKHQKQPSIGVQQLHATTIMQILIAHDKPMVRHSFPLLPFCLSLSVVALSIVATKQKMKLPILVGATATFTSSSA